MHSGMSNSGAGAADRGPIASCCHGPPRQRSGTPEHTHRAPRSRAHFLEIKSGVLPVCPELDTTAFVPAMAGVVRDSWHPAMFHVVPHDALLELAGGQHFQKVNLYLPPSIFPYCTGADRLSTASWEL